jgi:hypothetical protein
MWTMRVYTRAGTYIHSRARHIQFTGGTLSECAARERVGGTFHFGNVPGLAPTNLGKDTCLCSLRIPTLCLLPPPPHAPTSPPMGQNAPNDHRRHRQPETLYGPNQPFIDIHPHVRRAMRRLVKLPDRCIYQLFSYASHFPDHERIDLPVLNEFREPV